MSFPEAIIFKVKNKDFHDDSRALIGQNLSLTNFFSRKVQSFPIFEEIRKSNFMVSSNLVFASDEIAVSEEVLSSYYKEV